MSATEAVQTTIVKFQMNNEIQEGQLTMAKIQDFIDHFPGVANMEENVYKILKSKLSAVESLVSGLDAYDNADTPAVIDTDLAAKRKEAVTAVLVLAGGSVANDGTLTGPATNANLASLTAYGGVADAKYHNVKRVSLFDAVQQYAFGNLDTVAFDDFNKVLVDAAGRTAVNPSTSLIGSGTGTILLRSARGYGDVNETNNEEGEVLHEDSGLARLVYYLMLDAKYNVSSAPLFATSGKRQAVLGQVKEDTDKLVYTSEKLTSAGTSADLFDNGAAKALMNIMIAIASRKRTVTIDDVQQEKVFLGGEQYPYASLMRLFSTYADQDANDDAEVARFYSGRMALDNAMTVAEINDAYDLGWTSLTDFGITASNGDAAAASGLKALNTFWGKDKTHALIAANGDASPLTSRLSITKNTPPLRNILDSKLGDSLLKMLLLNTSNADIDFENGIENALVIAALGTTNAAKTWKGDGTDAQKAEGSAEKELSYQSVAINEALTLINRARGLATPAQPVFTRWRDILQGDVDHSNTSNTLEHLDVDDQVFTVLEGAQYWANGTTSADKPGTYFTTGGKNVMTYLENEIYVSRASEFTSSAGSSKLSIKELTLPSSSNTDGVSYLKEKAGKVIKCLRSIAFAEFMLLGNDKFFTTLNEMADTFKTPKMNNGSNDSRLISMFNKSTDTAVTNNRGRTTAGATASGDSILNQLFDNDQEIQDYFTRTTVNGVNVDTNDTDAQIRAQVVSNMLNGELTTVALQGLFVQGVGNLDAFRSNFVHLFKHVPQELQPAAGAMTTSVEGSVKTPAMIVKVATAAVSKRANGEFDGDHILTNTFKYTDGVATAWTDNASDRDSALVQSLVDAISTNLIAGAANAKSTKRRLEIDQSKLRNHMSLRELMESNIADGNDATRLEIFRSDDNTVNADIAKIQSVISDMPNPASDPEDGYSQRNFVQKMIYKMVYASESTEVTKLLTGGNSWEMDGTAANTQGLKAVRQIISSVASLKATTGKATADEMSEFYYAIFNNGAGSTADHVALQKQLISMANAMSLDLEFSQAEQMPYLLSGNKLSEVKRRALVIAIADHVHFTAADLNVIQAMGTADGTTAAQKVAASKVDSRLEHVARNIVKNQALWVSTTDTTGYASMLKAISDATFIQDAETGPHILLWAAALADPSAASDSGANGTVYDTDLRCAGLGKESIDEVLKHLTHSQLFDTIHVVSEVSSAGDGKIGTAISRELVGHAFVALTHDTSEIAVPGASDAVTGECTFTLYTGNHL